MLAAELPHERLTGPGGNQGSVYVSRAVRSICKNPVPEASVTLLVEVANDADPEQIRAALDAVHAATVTTDLPFETFRVEVPHAKVGEVCAVDGLATVETDATLTVDADGVGEDLEW